MKIGILGAGIAGLGVGHSLINEGCDTFTIYEASDKVGGLARSFKWHGFDCDLAPHRLFTEDNEIREQMLALTPMHKLRRRSEIYIRGKWIQDPVNGLEVIMKFFPAESMRIVWYYLFRDKHPETSFESLVLNQFGKGLNEFFFKPYSEKLFGVPADQISPVWGRRKIRVGGLKDMLRRKSRLYFKEFYYPDQNGYGAITNALFAKVKNYVQLETRLIGLEKMPDSDGYYCTFQRGDEIISEEYDALVSSLPITILLQMLGKPLNLSFRPAILTYLLINKPRITKNHWYYIADGEHKINRVAEFKNFAVCDLPEDKTVICCEITNTAGYSVEAVINELKDVGLVDPKDILDSKVVKIPEAYPIYDLQYENQMEVIRDFCLTQPNLFLIGRNAQFLHQDVDEIFATGLNVAQQLLQQKEPVSVSIS